MAVLPENADFQMSLESAKKPTYTFIIDWSARQISGMDSGLAAMRQAAEIILQNERFRWQIHSSDFGSELENLAGEEYDYIVSEIPRRIKEAFSSDKRFLSTENFVFSEPGEDHMICTFDVVTVFGSFRKEVTL